MRATGARNEFLRNLFWQLDDAGPWLLTGLLLLLFIADWRRTAVVSLTLSALCAVAMGVVFHLYYAIPIWGGHESAIRSLDRSALWAGFAAGAFAALVAALAHRALRSKRRVGLAPKAVNFSVFVGRDQTPTSS
jgi:hypothetical protein